MDVILVEGQQKQKMDTLNTKLQVYTTWCIMVHKYYIYILNYFIIYIIYYYTQCSLVIHSGCNEALDSSLQSQRIITRDMVDHVEHPSKSTKILTQTSQKKHKILTSKVITDPRGIVSSVGCHVLAGLALSIEVDSLGGGEIQQWKYLE